MKDCLQVYFFISFVAQRAGSKKLDVKVVTREGFETVYTEDEEICMAFALKADFQCDIVIMRQEMSSREAAHLLAFSFAKE